MHTKVIFEQEFREKESKDTPMLSPETIMQEK
jgi:hypothetical protein